MKSLGYVVGVIAFLLIAIVGVVYVLAPTNENKSIMQVFAHEDNTQIISLLVENPEVEDIFIPTVTPSPIPTATPVPTAVPQQVQQQSGGGVNYNTENNNEEIDYDSQKGGGALGASSDVQSQAQQYVANESYSGDYRPPSVVGSTIFVDRNDPRIPRQAFPYLVGTSFYQEGVLHTRCQAGDAIKSCSMIRGYDLISSGDRTLVSTIDGTVAIPTIAKPTWNFNSGQMSGCPVEANNNTYIYIENGLFSTLAYHMSSCNVSIGQSVSAGQNIGVEGNVGVSFENHVHFATNVIIDRVRYPVCNIEIFAVNGEDVSIFRQNCSAANAYRIQFYD